MTPLVTGLLGIIISNLPAEIQAGSNLYKLLTEQAKESPEEVVQIIIGLASANSALEAATKSGLASIGVPVAQGQPGV